MKVLDCFIFNDELEILDIRLNILNNYVDKFIIVESIINHQGNYKKKHFNINLFKKFEKKIKYITIEEIPKNFSAWQRENYQRNYISKGLEEFSPEDIAIVSDADEIPNLKNIDFTKLNNNYYTFEQDHFHYKLNLKKQTKWNGSKMCKIKNLKSPQWLRSLKMHKKYSRLRLDKYFSKNYVFDFKIIKNGGWHFGWLKTIENMILKIKSFAHTEYNISLYKDENFIKECVKNYINFLDTKEKLERVEINENFPEYIRNNKEKLKNWIA